MKAKETVMGFDAIITSADFNKPMMVWLGKVLKAQAEISFAAGRKDVVEWMDENCLGCQSNTPCNREKYLGFHQSSWQAKLKEWGL